MKGVQLICLLLGAFGCVCDAQEVTGCPGYGCSPRGTFSYQLKVPNATENGRIAWIHDGFIGPIPKPLGCIGNPDNIVCQTNGPRYVGYVSLDVFKGTMVWQDPYTRFPVLPVMDIFGDIIGSDGHQLIRVDDDGKMYPPIEFGEGIFPVYSLIPSFNGIVIIVSQNGLIFGYGASGIPFASITLPATIERTNGTFLPVAQPIIAENRIYLLTEFLPDDGQNNLGLQRLYAIDVFTRMVDRLHVTWYFNFEREATYKPIRRKMSILQRDFWKSRDVIEMTMTNEEVGGKITEDDSDPSLLYDAATKCVFVNLAEPLESSNAPRTLWALRDDGDAPTYLYKIAMDVRQMAMADSSNYTSSAGDRTETGERFGSTYYKPDDSHSDRGTETKEQQSKVKNLWAILNDMQTILHISKTNGTILGEFDINNLLSTQNSNITSDVMISRSSDDADDILIFGVTTNSKNPEFDIMRRKHNIKDNQTSFIVGVHGTEWRLIWMYATPENLPVVGQIAGIPLATQINDILVAFTGNSTVSQVFAITSN